jgi:hypothetical protein
LELFTVAKQTADEAAPKDANAPKNTPASVSQEVDAKIRDQIRSGTWPLRLKSEDWTSGEINWLIDVIAPDRKTAASVLGNFKQVVKDGELRLHPLIARLVDKETLEKMGAARDAGTTTAKDAGT